MPRRRAAGVLHVVLVLLPLTACGTADETPLRVSAAASLADAFEEIGAAFGEAHPGAEVELNLAGSPTLVEQVRRGAPADVLATADPVTMQRALEANVVEDPVPFAANRLQVAGPADGPAREPADLADEDLLVGLCAPEVPCGALARASLADLGIVPAPDTEDPDVRTLLARLAAGELDVGVVYATDVAASEGAVHGTDLPGARTQLLAATTAGAPERARAFVEFLRSPTALAILREHDFEAPA